MSRLNDLRLLLQKDRQRAQTVERSKYALPPHVICNEEADLETFQRSVGVVEESQAIHHLPPHGICNEHVAAEFAAGGIYPVMEMEDVDRLREDNRRLRERAARLEARNEELRYKLRQKYQPNQDVGGNVDPAGCRWTNEYVPSPDLRPRFGGGYAPRWIAPAITSSPRQVPCPLKQPTPNQDVGGNVDPAGCRWTNEYVPSPDLRPRFGGGYAPRWIAPAITSSPRQVPCPLKQPTPNQDVGGNVDPAGCRWTNEYVPSPDLRPRFGGGYAPRWIAPAITSSPRQVPCPLKQPTVETCDEEKSITTEEERNVNEIEKIRSQTTWNRSSAERNIAIVKLLRLHSVKRHNIPTPQALPPNADDDQEKPVKTGVEGNVNEIEKIRSQITRSRSSTERNIAIVKLLRLHSVKPHNLTTPLNPTPPNAGTTTDETYPLPSETPTEEEVNPTPPNADKTTDETYPLPSETPTEEEVKYSPPFRSPAKYLYPIKEEAEIEKRPWKLEDWPDNYLLMIKKKVKTVSEGKKVQNSTPLPSIKVFVPTGVEELVKQFKKNLQSKK